MSDPPRILESHRGGLTRAMFRAAKETPAPPAGARDQLLDALGLGAVSSSAGQPTSKTAIRERGRVAPRRLFSAVLQPGSASPRRLGTSAIVAVVSHAALLVIVVLHGAGRAPEIPIAEPRTMVRLITPRAHDGDPRAPVTWRAELAPPVAPARSSDVRAVSAGRSAGELAGEKTTPAKEEPPQRPVVATGAAPSSPSGAQPAPSEARVAVPVAVPAGVNDVLPFGEGMTRPSLLEGPEIAYTREAREAKVEGTMLVRCVITMAGALERCQILKSLPLLDQPVLEALSRQRYRPATFQGRAVNVTYTIPLRFALP